MPSQVQVRVYIDGRGPLHVFTAPLKGLGQNRLDLDAIMREYNLKAIYAFSLAKGRGNRLFFDPRNGLSRLAYSGNPNAIILLDGDPSDPFPVLLGKVLFGFFLIGGFALVTLSDLLPEWLVIFMDSRRSYFVILTCFITMLYTQLVWRPMKKVRFMAYGQAPERSQQIEAAPEDRPLEDKKDL